MQIVPSNKFPVLSPHPKTSTGFSGVGVPFCIVFPVMLHAVSGLPFAVKLSGGVPESSTVLSATLSQIASRYVLYSLSFINISTLLKASDFHTHRLLHREHHRVGSFPLSDISSLLLRTPGIYQSSFPDNKH